MYIPHSNKDKEYCGNLLAAGTVPPGFHVHAVHKEFQNPPALSIKSYVNGELRQNSTTDLLIFGIAHVVSELSQGMTLQAGTIIAMGTPAGVGMGFVPPNFLKAGDEVKCEIEGIGTLTNVVE